MWPDMHPAGEVYMPLWIKEKVGRGLRFEEAWNPHGKPVLARQPRNNGTWGIVATRLWPGPFLFNAKVSVLRCPSRSRLLLLNLLGSFWVFCLLIISLKSISLKARFWVGKTFRPLQWSIWLVLTYENTRYTYKEIKIVCLRKFYSEKIAGQHNC